MDKLACCSWLPPVITCIVHMLLCMHTTPALPRTQLVHQHGERVILLVLIATAASCRAACLPARVPLSWSVSS